MAGRSSSSSTEVPVSDLTLPTHVGEKSSKKGKRSSAAAATSGGVERTQTHQTHHSRASSRPEKTPKWWKTRLFRGIINDLRRRAPYYWSDWKDAWDYRVVPATVYMYFANILPALAFSLDMYTSTNKSYGVNEVLLASVLGAVVFSLFACQPLVIVGVTGPITVFNYTVFDIMKPKGSEEYPNYLAFMCWIGIWSMIFHWILAVTNSCNWLKYVTRFPCDIFGFYVAFIYLQKGIQVLDRLRETNEEFPEANILAAKYMSIAIALLVFLFAYAATELGTSSLFHHHVRVFLKDYGTPLTLVFFTGFAYMGSMGNLRFERLEITKAFFPTDAEHHPGNWLIDFWNLPTKDIFIAIPFALLLTILFWFDHNVSSLIAQGTEFPLKKPAGFHWDLFLLGLTTGVAGLIGLPAPNGLIPQAPFHTESLCVTEVTMEEDEKGDSEPKLEFKPVKVVEQRFSNLAQGLLTLGTMTGPLLTVLHLVPHGVLAGLFFVMGVQALEANGITAKLLFLLRDTSLTAPKHPLRSIGKRAVWWFVILELAGFGATFAITQTIAAVGFPVFIFVLLPIRAFLLPKWFSPRELGILDEATASDFTMESCGGTYGNEIIEGEGHTSSSEDEDGDAGGVLSTRNADGSSVQSNGVHQLNNGAAKSDVELAEEGQAGGHLNRRHHS